MARVKAEDNREIDLMFIHSELDDLGLDPYEFRIYSRLVRRAGKHGVAHESVANMAEGCRMSERKARQALRVLEELGLVTRTERSGATTEYSLTHQRHWVRRPEQVDSGDTPARDAAPTPAPHAAPPRHDMPPTPAPGAAKGNPLKVIPLKEVEPPTPLPKPKAKKSRAGELRHEFDPINVAENLPANFDPDRFLDFCSSRLKLKKPMTAEALKRFLGRHESTPREVLDVMFDNAIEGGWQRLYDLKPDELKALEAASAQSRSGEPDPMAQYRERGL